MNQDYLCPMEARVCDRPAGGHGRSPGRLAVARDVDVLGVLAALWVAPDRLAAVKYAASAWS